MSNVIKWHQFLLGDTKKPNFIIQYYATKQIHFLFGKLKKFYITNIFSNEIFGKGELIYDKYDENTSIGENDILEAYEYDIPFFGGSISNYDYQYVGFQGKYYKYKDFYNGGGLAFNAIRANTVFQIIKTIENKDVENLNGVNPLIFTLPNGDGYTPFGIIMDFICNWNNNNIPDITIAENSYTVSVLNGAAAYHTKITQEM